MGGHRRFRRGHHGGSGATGFFRRPPADPRLGGGAPLRLKPVVRVALIVGLVVWSLLAWAAYVLVDPSLKWIAAGTGTLVESGKAVATATGVGKDVGSLAEGLNAGGLWDWILALLKVALKPAIIVLWAIGALALIAAPLVLPRVARLLAWRRH